jgi:hypothetical protein
MFESKKLHSAKHVLDVLPFKTTRALRAWAQREGVTPYRLGETTVAYLGDELNDAIARSAGARRPLHGAAAKGS